MFLQRWLRKQHLSTGRDTNGYLTTKPPNRRVIGFPGDHQLLGRVQRVENIGTNGWKIGWKTHGKPYGKMILEANKQSLPQCVPLHRATLLFPIFRPVIISLWGVQFGTFWNHAPARVLFQSYLQILSFCMFLDPTS